MVRVYLLYLYSASYCTTGPLIRAYQTSVDLSEISILSSYVSVTRLSFPVLYFPHLHSPRLLTPSPFVCVRVPQFLSVSLDLFCYGHVTLLRTFWCIPRIMTRLVTLPWLDLSVLVYKDSCSDHSLFRLGLLCEIQDLKPPLSFAHSCSLSSSHHIVSILCAKALTLVCDLI